MKKLLLSFLCCMLAVIGMQAEEVTLNYADVVDKGTSGGGGGGFEYEVSPINFSFTNAYGNSAHIKAYASCDIKITGATITKVVINAIGASYIKTWGSSDNSDVQVSGTTATWIGSSNDITLTNTATGQARISSIVVTYSTTGSETPGEGGEDPVEPTPDPEDPVEPTPDPEDPVEPTPEGETVVFDATQQSYANGVAIESVDIASGIVATFDKGSNSNAPKYYTSGTAIRCYGGNNFTIASTVGNITKVVLTYGEDDGSNAIITDCGTFDTNTWTGKSESVKFTVDGSKGNRRIQKIAVTYKAEEGVVLPPTFDPAGGIEFVESMDVTIVPASNDLSVYYSFVENGEYVEYTQPITITETTTVYAYAKNAEDKQSDVVSATYTRKEIVEGVWTKVTDATTLIEGAEVVIVAEESDYALSTTQKASNRGQGEVIKDGDAVYFGEDVQILTIERGTVAGSWAFYATGVVDEDGLAQNNGYLYAASSSANHLKTQATKDGNGSWNVTIADGVTSIVAQGSYSHNVLQYNTNLFSCYASASQKGVSLYRKYAEANITSDNCYNLAVGEAWEEPEGCWYAAKFINANTGEYTWSVASDRDDEHTGYIFYLAPGNTPLGHEPQLDPDFKYTHVEFVQLPATVEEPADIRTLDLTGVEYTTTGVIWYDGVSSKTYSIAEKAWMAVGTGLNRVELADGIGYAYGVVSAEGAIEVYNVNGAVVARGNDNVDLRGLGRGVYIIRNGNQVRKVVR